MNVFTDSIYKNIKIANPTNITPSSQQILHTRPLTPEMAHGNCSNILSSRATPRVALCTAVPTRVSQTYHRSPGRTGQRETKQNKRSRGRSALSQPDDNSTAFYLTAMASRAPGGP